MAADLANDPAVSNLRNYLRIRTVHPNVNYAECLAYLRGQASELGLPVQVFEVVANKPVLVMTWEGLEPALASVLLNSHMDVVPVFEKSWKHPPFEARIEDGVIYGRGVQDMKSVGIQYIEAVRRMKTQGIRLKRTLHLSFVPDEEVGGSLGMGEFVKTEHFRKLNVGFSLDEGIASATDEYHVYYGERSIWHLNVVCPGKSGHGSMLLSDNCGEKQEYYFTQVKKPRISAVACTKNLDSTRDVTSVNLTILQGGIQSNVVPEQFTATFDIRLALAVDHQEFEDMIKRWCSEAGSNVTYNFTQKDPHVAPTKLDDSNPYWLAFKTACEKLNLPIKLLTFPGGTDSRYIRQLGVPALGFSPMARTEPGLHQHNESLKLITFLQGITAYQTIIPAVCNVA